MDFDDEAPTVRIPRESMLEARERSAPARTTSRELVWNPLEEPGDPGLSDGVPLPIADSATDGTLPQRFAS